MTFLCCPLCGLNRSLKHYDPSSFEDDILGVEVQGLGRRKGFLTLEKFSLLADAEVMNKVKERVLDIVDLLRDKGLIDDDELRERFGTQEDDGTVEDAGGYVEDSSEEANDLDPRIQGVVKKIERAMDRDLSGEGEDPIDRLEAGVDVLVDDYLAYVAVDEDGL